MSVLQILHGLNVDVMPCVIILLPLKAIISSDLNLPAYTFVMCKIKATYLLTELHVKLDIFPLFLHFLRLHWSL